MNYSIIYSLKFIIKFRYRNTLLGISRYIYWQFLKIFNLFPRDVNFSKSKIHFSDLNLASQGGTKLFCCGVYDYDNMFFARDLLMLYTGVFIDVGANIGVYSVFMSELSSIKVVSIEPHPITYEHLLKNVHINRRVNIMSFNNAIGNNENFIKFSDIPGSSINKVVDSNSQSKYILVKQKKLSKIIDKINISPAVVKIDTEGYELHVLEGMDEYLKDVKMLIIEISKDWEEINKILAPYFDGPFYVDYKNKLIKKEKYYSEDPVYINKLFVNEILKQLNFQYSFSKLRHV